MDADAWGRTFTLKELTGAPWAWTRGQRARASTRGFGG